MLRESFYRRMAALALRLSSDSPGAVAPLVTIAGDMAEKAKQAIDAPPVSPFSQGEDASERPG